MANPFVHVELHADDPTKAKEFYGKLLGWKLEDVPMGNMTYTTVNPGEGTGGGIMKNPVPGAPSHWLAYILVDDLTASLGQAKELGATVLSDRMEVPGHGWFGIISDPTGAVVGLWQAMHPE